EPGQGLTVPKLVRIPQQRRRMLGVSGFGQRARLTAEPAELIQVDGLGVDVEQVAMGAGHQARSVDSGMLESPSQPGDISREALPRLSRRARVPQPIDEQLGRHYRAGR